ncbi:MAG: inositol-3-phosphate synthase [Marine Group III euryarchaeote CG-Epi2]|uniref:Inositol-3-phosphate synthase n=1 Tax=Marine Group III euryarchaeote CG-Epi2 TaxID=1888996 RepID=A0A1J5U6J8_9ARCH|nr:MAG: inositol-3-phosphate synthase [Marine Group III euryarchaeote CG-Epi2]|tara:strand:+ start:1759 stop:3093 length:1335 start_codon:yes stop_codon:yes gene_type:complete
MVPIDSPTKIKPAKGKLGVLMPGLGAVSTTFIAGTLAIRNGISSPIGSLTQMGTLRLGKRTDNREVDIKDFVPITNLDDLVFGGWDIFEDNCYEAAINAGVIDTKLLDQVKDELSSIKPMKAVFDKHFVKKLEGTYVKSVKGHRARIEALRQDIQDFKKKNNVERMVMVWCGSTEVYQKPEGSVYDSLDSFEAALDDDETSIAPSILYAYAAIKEGIPYANGAPNLSVDFPAMYSLASKEGVPIAGKDFKTGQTLMKTILAPGFKARRIGIDGWFSTNILGNRDGEVLDDPESFKTKEVSKLGVLEEILEPEKYPELYGDLYHKVRINYYPPRGDNKEGWDNIDIKGWLGYPMQIKVDFLCRDSILAAPIVLDLALFLDLAKRSSMHGIQEWLSFYFKSPMCKPDLYPIHDLFAQKVKLENTLRHLMGETLITHLGLDYYYDED